MATIEDDVESVSVNDNDRQYSVSENLVTFNVTETKDDVTVVVETPAAVSVSGSGESYTVQQTPETTFSVSDTVNVSIVQGEDYLNVPYTQEIDFVGETTVYKGWALPGSATSSPVWRIQRIVFNAEGDATKTWANLGASDQIWDNRASLSYS